jgi:hypothetical protein
MSETIDRIIQHKVYDWTGAAPIGSGRRNRRRSREEGDAKGFDWNDLGAR